jgi:exonuclease III
MKIVTWNIGEDEQKEDGKLDIESYNYIVNYIKHEEIDIICLQEAIIKSDYLPNIAQYISENTSLKYNIQYELSDSHINIGCRMGVVICSKYKIDDYEKVLLDNPNFIYSKDNNITYYSHDKGFIISNIKGINIITGHCLPFHVFKKNPLDYLDIFKKIDEKFMEIYLKNNKFILCGDFNYDDVNKLFPQIMKYGKDLIKQNTRKDKQLDHFIISNNLNYSYCEVKDNIFDHKLGIFEIDI